MRVAWVSTFPPALCGIGTYSFYLTRELQKHTHNLIVKDWKYGSIFFPFQIFHGIVKANPDVIHVQHEYMMYGPAQRSVLFPLLLLFLKFYRRRVAVTMHTVVPKQMLSRDFFTAYHVGGRFFKLKQWLVIFFTKSIGRLSDKVIVHTEACRDSLIAEYGFEKEKILIIPHPVMGTPEKIPGQKKKKDFIVSQFGFIKESKGIHHVISILPKLREKINVHFLIVGATRKKLEEIEYTNNIKRLIKKIGMASHVTFINHFVPFRDLPSILSQADIFVFPYTERLLSDSGALKMVLFYGKPIIATRIRGFQDLSNSIILIDSDNIQRELNNAITRLLTDRKLREKYGVEALKLTEKYRLEKIAEETYKVYKSLARKKDSK